MNHLRCPEEIMSAPKLGAFHSSYLSFSRSLVRTMLNQSWLIKRATFDLDDDGYGTAVYRIELAGLVCHAVFFAQFIEDEERNDRVIAEKWDVTCCIWLGEIDQQNIEMLSKNVPKQEKGRYNPNVICLSRANKSMRLFSYVIDCLSRGDQPEMDEIRKCSYFVRTTAVYGNGKFGMADYQRLQGTALSDQFRVQMLMVYMVRWFSFEWVDHMASKRGGQNAVPLSDSIKRSIGVGNSTGLGMGPYLIKHPQIIHSWVSQREQALFEVIHQSKPNKDTINAVQHYFDRAQQYFGAISVPDPMQTAKNKQLLLDLDKIKQMPLTSVLQAQSWMPLWQEINTQAFCQEVKELLLNILLEVTPDIADKYANFQPVKLKLNGHSHATISDLISEIEQNYHWAIRLDLTDENTIFKYWYVAEDKEEPRLGDRFVEKPQPNQEMKIDIGRAVNRLYEALVKAQSSDLNMRVSRFLFDQPQYSGIVRRVWQYAQNPYGEIRSNVLDKNFYPIDILRLKLSFFGAGKFDPKSDKWLRITLFQGAPLLNDQGHLAPPDDWFLYND